MSLLELSEVQDVDGVIACVRVWLSESGHMGQVSGA